jgi:hypothetical protein
MLIFPTAATFPYRLNLDEKIRISVLNTLVAITGRKVRNFKTVYKVKTHEISKNIF